MKAITLRNVPANVAQAVLQKAKKMHTSLNRAVVALLEERVGTSEGSKGRLHHDLDPLFGRWSRKEAGIFDKALSKVRKIDEELWR